MRESEFSAWEELVPGGCLTTLTDSNLIRVASDGSNGGINPPGRETPAREDTRMKRTTFAAFAALTFALFVLAAAA